MGGPKRAEMLERKPDARHRAADLHRRTGRSAARTISPRSNARASSTPARPLTRSAMTRIAVLQMTTGHRPGGQCRDAGRRGRASAAQGGAAMLFTPEMSGLLDRDRERAAAHIVAEERQPGARRGARGGGARTACGSRSARWRWRARTGAGPTARFVIDADGDDRRALRQDPHVRRRRWRAAKAGANPPPTRRAKQVVTAETPLGRLGLTVCYDIRFPALFEELGRRSCDVIAIPAAFTVPTGEAHWHLLQRARAVEASAYVVAAAQVGTHADGRRDLRPFAGGRSVGRSAARHGRRRRPGWASPRSIRARIAEVRAQLPSLANRRPIP